MKVSYDRQSLGVGGVLFALTLGWMFFFDMLKLSPDSVLQNIGNIENLGFIATIPFVGFILLFVISLGLIMAYADRNERTRVWTAVLAPTFLAFGIGTIAFSHFAQWYPLAIFYLGALIMGIETARMKRVELQNFPVFRSNFAGIQRAMQLISIGVFITLALFAYPQNNTLYSSFEDSLFAGKVIQELNVEDVTASLYVSAQVSALGQIAQNPTYVAIQTTTDPAVQDFVNVFDGAYEKIQSPEYKDQIRQQIAAQQEGLDSKQVAQQIKDLIPGYGALQSFFWVVSAIMGTLLFVFITMLLVQPLSAAAGWAIYNVIPLPTETGSTPRATEKAMTPPPAPSASEWNSTPAPALEADHNTPPAPFYTHTEDTHPGAPPLSL